MTETPPAAADEPIVSVDVNQEALQAKIDEMKQGIVEAVEKVQAWINERRDQAIAGIDQLQTTIDTLQQQLSDWVHSGDDEAVAEEPSATPAEAEAAPPAEPSA
jgi:uncharacterized coiled-coil DUF342 family protein